MAKYYVRVDMDKNIVKGFSDAFESPLDTDYCIQEDGERQFMLFNEFNPSLLTDKLYKYKYIKGTVVEKSRAEIDLEKNIVVEPKTQIELMQEQIDTLTQQISQLIGE